MSGLLGRLGGWCARRGRAVLALWVIAAVLLTAGSILFPGPVNSNAAIPGTNNATVETTITITTKSATNTGS